MDGGSDGGSDGGPDAGTDGGSDAGLVCPPSEVLFQATIADLCFFAANNGEISPLRGVVVATEPPTNSGTTDDAGLVELCLPPLVPLTLTMANPKATFTGYFGEVVLRTDAVFRLFLPCSYVAMVLDLSSATDGLGVVVGASLTLSPNNSSCSGTPVRDEWDFGFFGPDGGDLAREPDGGENESYLTPGLTLVKGCPTNIGAGLLIGLPLPPVDGGFFITTTMRPSAEVCIGDAGPPATCVDQASELGFTGRLRVGAWPDFLSVGLHFIP